MSEDPRIGLVRDAFDAFDRRDGEGVAAFLHPEVETRVVSPLLNAGTWQGPAGFAEMVAGWNDVWGTVRYEMTAAELVDDRVVLVSVHQEATGVGSGVPVELDVIYLVEFEGDRAIRFQVHADRDSALAAV